MACSAATRVGLHGSTVEPPSSCGASAAAGCSCLPWWAAWDASTADCSPENRRSRVGLAEEPSSLTVKEKRPAAVWECGKKSSGVGELQ
ncbi:hypothetical protein CHLRE_06g253753v5 [Chlamydomonas reinhardtii]|uniref:Uncharacterized protein n=1 Tax=Chlamydomonas reinhardtii TaxID=3055 RepID=A0A2K3DM55_CHLRE|nr:uncharacterized protein CHLRE_06g253753v5 [Chlamydomonas reinhardtii]PNW81619.1 hypothetical protein CHLRE_06g253753v5 [Chlamydomonas reinhardtii]